jgi:hypothetical protein
MKTLFLLTVLTTVIAAAGCGDPRADGGPAQAGPAAARPAPARHDVKPDPPINLEAWFDSRPSPGSVARVSVAVTSDVDLGDCSLTVRLPEGLSLAEGVTDWRGALAHGSRRTHALAVRVPDGRRYEIVVSARADLGGGTVAARSMTLALNDEAAAKPAAPEDGVKTNSRGEKILELPAGPPR